MNKRLDRTAENRLYVGAETLASMFDCGRATAVKLGIEAQARVKYGKCVRFNVAKVEAYLQELAQKGEESHV